MRACCNLPKLKIPKGVVGVAGKMPRQCRSTQRFDARDVDSCSGGSEMRLLEDANCWGMRARTYHQAIAKLGLINRGIG